MALYEMSWKNQDISYKSDYVWLKKGSQKHLRWHEEIFMKYVQILKQKCMEWLNLEKTGNECIDRGEGGMLGNVHFTIIWELLSASSSGSIPGESWDSGFKVSWLALLLSIGRGSRRSHRLLLKSSTVTSSSSDHPWRIE